jgi:hypothetical protein
VTEEVKEVADEEKPTEASDHTEAKQNPEPFPNFADTNFHESDSIIPTDEEMFATLHGYKPSESPEEAAKQILKDGLVSAAQQLVHLAENGATERVRLESSKYVLEWNLGKPVGQSGLSDPWKELLGDIQTKDKASGE